jgi:hypothetical protein
VIFSIIGEAASGVPEGVANILDGNAVEGSVK